MDFLKLSVSLPELVLRTVIIYVVFMFGLRVFGKREIGQFTIFDLVLILLIANALQPAITGPDTSVTAGVVIIVVLLLVNRGVALLRARFPNLGWLIEPQPTTIAEDGRWIMPNLKKEDLDLKDVEMALREHGVEKVEDARLVVLEEDGSISVVPKDVPTSLLRRRRRVRIVRRD